jgi:hypothetical protein
MMMRKKIWTVGKNVPLCSEELKNNVAICNVIICNVTGWNYKGVEVGGSSI